MKRKFSLFLVTAMLLQSLTSCASVKDSPTASISSSISVTASDAEQYGEWLTERLGQIDEKLVIGIGDSGEHGIDMSDFEDDGYIIRSYGDSTVIFGKTEDGLDMACRRYVNDTVLYGEAKNIVYHEGTRIGEFKLFDRPISDFSVVYTNGAKAGAEEFAKLAREACGIELPVTETEKESGNIIISISAYLAPTAYSYRVNNENLLIRCGKDAIISAVRSFFEDECGWDGLPYGNPTLKESDSVNIPDTLNKSVTPVFDLFSVNYSGVFRLTDTETELCFSDDSFFSESEEDVREYLTQCDSSNTAVNDIGISLGSSYCSCESCLTLMEAENSRAGSAIKFANRLSASFPDTSFVIFAEDSEVTKTTAPADKVAIAASGKAEQWLESATDVRLIYGSNIHSLIPYSDLYSPFHIFNRVKDSGISGMYVIDTQGHFSLDHINNRLMYFLNKNPEATLSEYNDKLYSLLRDEFGDGCEFIYNYIVETRSFTDPDSALGFDAEKYHDSHDTAVSLIENGISFACSREQQKNGELLMTGIYYIECMLSYFNAYYSADKSEVERLDGMYSQMIKTFENYGVDTDLLRGTKIGISDTLYRAAWSEWIDLQSELYAGTVPAEDEEVLEFSQKVNCHISKNTMSFALQSDSHYSSEWDNGWKDKFNEKLTKYQLVNRYVDLDFSAHLGDITNGNQSTAELALQSLTEATDLMKGLHIGSPYIFLRGNHDDNSWYGYETSGFKKFNAFPENTVLTTDIWSKFSFAEKNDNIVVGDSGMYGYMDHEDSKIRVLFVDTSDLPYIEEVDGVYKYGAYTGHAIRQDQLQFMADAMTFSDKGEDGKNWAILVLSHVPIETMRTVDSEYRFGSLDSLGRNFLAFLRILKAYQRGEVFDEAQKSPTNYGDGGYNTVSGGFSDGPTDFTYDVYADYTANGQGEVIGMIVGHTHVDNYSNEVGYGSYDKIEQIYPKLSLGYPYFSIGHDGMTAFTISRNGDGTGEIHVNKFGTSYVTKQDMIAEGDDAVATTDKTSAGCVSSVPDSGSIASGDYTVKYSQNR